jgi:hypothetical protein
MLEYLVYAGFFVAGLNSTNKAATIKAAIAHGVLLAVLYGVLQCTEGSCSPAPVAVAGVLIGAVVVAVDLVLWGFGFGIAKVAKSIKG